MAVNIETDVPIPVTKGEPRTEMGRVVRKMKPGESIFCDRECDKESARQVIRSLGGRYVTRKMDGGWRVWRIV